MKKKKRGEPSDKLVLKQAVKKKVNYMLKKPNIDPGEAYNLVKNFFKVFTNHDYEFTREELIKELDKVYLPEETKKRCEEIISALGVVEFYETNLSQDEIRKNITDFAEIVEKLVHQEGVKFGFWDDFAKRFRRKGKKEKKLQKHEPTLMEKFLDEVEHEKIDEAPEENVETQEPTGPDIMTVPVEDAQPFQQAKPSRNPLAALEEAGTEEIIHEMQKQPREPGSPQSDQQINSELNQLQEKLDKEKIEVNKPPAEPAVTEIKEQVEEKPAELEKKEENPDAVPNWVKTSNVEMQDPPDFHSEIPNNAPGMSLTEEFDVMVQSFYQHLGEGSLDTARLEYEEMMYEYQKMTPEKKEIYYEKLMKVYNDLQDRFSQG